MTNFNTDITNPQIVEALRLINQCEGNLHELERSEKERWFALPQEVRLNAFSYLSMIRNQMGGVLNG